MKNLNVRNLMVVAFLMNLVGCSTVGSMVKNVESDTNKNGLIYGLALKSSAKEMADVCGALKNRDARCDNPKTTLYVVMSRFGYASGAGGVFAFADVDLGIKANVCGSGFGDQKNCNFVKATVEPGKLGTVLEVVSRPGENVCKWAGLPRVGGVVCEKFGWNYKDHEDVIIDF